MKRFKASLFLLLSALLLMLPAAAEGEKRQYVAPVDYLKSDTVTDTFGVVYYLYPDYAVVVGYDDNLLRLFLPDSFEGLPVKVIAPAAFAERTRLEEIVIPFSVEMIGKEAFRGASSLRKVTMDCPVTEIPDGCFSGCDSLQKILLPSSVVSVGESAFSGCFRLGKVTLPLSLEAIAPDAFDGCESLIFDCEDGSAAAEYASSHRIARSFVDTPSFQLIAVLLLSFALFLLIPAFLFFRKKAKKKKEGHSSQKKST